METKIKYYAKINGRAAEMVVDKCADYLKAKGRTLGLSRATEILLCELYNLRQSTENKTSCE